jgi:hypothetical protein
MKLKKKSGGHPSGNPPEISTDPIDPIQPDCPERELEERRQRSWENLAANIIAHERANQKTNYLLGLCRRLFVGHRYRRQDLHGL